HTIGPASRVAAVFGKIISEAYRAGAAGAPGVGAPGIGAPGAGGPGAGRAPGTGGAPGPATEVASRTIPGLTVPESFVPDATRIREAILAGVPDEVTAGALIAWSGLFGLVSFELFGQFENVVTDRAVFFDHAAARLGLLTGLPA
ncbi:MAG: WHG domain-containing protein, partial [Actinobacteria bacterium]|nr:WHG domain-containing protein [Actinomycetota bacterium]